MNEEKTCQNHFWLKSYRLQPTSMTRVWKFFVYWELCMLSTVIGDPYLKVFLNDFAFVTRYCPYNWFKQWNNRSLDECMYLFQAWRIYPWRYWRIVWRLCSQVQVRVANLGGMWLCHLTFIWFSNFSKSHDAKSQEIRPLNSPVLHNLHTVHSFKTHISSKHFQILIACKSAFKIDG